jgi:dolichyl-phosphate-mannose-protein mannosyltransferase
MAEREPLNPRWSRLDIVVVCVVFIVALAAHFWRLGSPNELVYDERTYVDEAFHYLRGETFFEVHPPLAILLIAECLRVFGCHAWSWRVSSALIGGFLPPISYLLARRLFHSRGAAAIGALLVLCEGMFLTYSRLGLINIVYVTLGAAAYLAAFRFVQSEDPSDRRRSLVAMGVLLGLCLGSKLAIPIVTWALVVGLVAFSVSGWYELSGERSINPPAGLGYLVGSVALVGGLSAVFFLLTFLPHYWLGWWSGVSALKSYYGYVASANLLYPPPNNHQDSAWWSWPVLFHPYAYWNGHDDLGRVETIWGGGSPAIWWGALVAIFLATIRALRRQGIGWIFLSLGYFTYTAMWVPIHRSLYIYSYLPALYVGVLAMAGMIDLCWKGKALVWEQIAMLLPVFAVSLFGLGWTTGAIVSAVTAAIWLALLRRAEWAGRFTAAIVLMAVVVVFFYFAPLWLMLPVSRHSFEARMWFNEAGVGNWL